MKMVMVKVNETCARGLIMLGQEVYVLHKDGSESLIEGGINAMWQHKREEFGIEGELFGKPYHEVEIAGDGSQS